MENEQGSHRGLVIVTWQARGRWKDYVRCLYRNAAQQERTDVEVGEHDLAHAVYGLGGLIRVVVPDGSLERWLVACEVIPGLSTCV